MSSPAWRWLWRGNLPAAAAHVEFTDEEANWPPTMKREMAADWQARLLEAKRSGRRLFEAPMAQLLGHRATATGGLDLRLGRTSYSHWLFSDGRQAAIEERFGAGTASRPLALSAAVITADGGIVVQERSTAVAEGAGLLHVVGGHLDPDEHRREGVPDPETAMRRELDEELGLREGDLDEGRLLGLGENRENGKPELLYCYRTGLGRDDLRARAERSRDRFEFDNLRFVGAGDGSLASLLAQPESRFAVPGLALLRLLAAMESGA